MKDRRRESSVGNIGAKPEANIVRLKCDVIVKKYP